jgi:hypothetical protein
MSLTQSARELLSKVEVLRDLDTKVREMMAVHEAKRELWVRSLTAPPTSISPSFGSAPPASPTRPVRHWRSTC